MGEPVTHLFADVRRNYFPRWDRAGRWAVRASAPPGRPTIRGYCDLDTRTIWIAHPDELTMIHEVVHAVAGAGLPVEDPGVVPVVSLLHRRPDEYRLIDSVESRFIDLCVEYRRVGGTLSAVSTRGLRRNDEI